MRLTRRARLAGVTLVAAALVLAGCGGGGDDDAGGNEVITADVTEPQNPLVPTSTNETGGGKVIDLLFAGLVTYKTDGTPENEVAESIESDDNQTWTITLKDWEFSDGTPVTANSFVDAWNYGALSTNAQNNSYFFESIEGYADVSKENPKVKEMSGLKVVDDKTFTVKLSQQESDFPTRLGYTAYFPLPESAFKDMKAFGEKPIGNGPYTLKSWSHDQELVLAPNKSYQGAREPQNAGVTFKVYTDLEAAYTDVQAGNLDVIELVPDGALSTFEKDDSVQAFTQPSSALAAFAFPNDLEHFALDDEGRLRRKAVSMAIDRAEITEEIFSGGRTPAKDFSAPTMPGWKDSIKGSEVLEFNPDEAKRLWAQANDIRQFEGEFVLETNTDGPGNKAYVEAVVNQVKNNLGIDAKPKFYATFQEFLDARDARKVGAFRAGWQPDYPSIGNYLGPIYGTDAGSNDGDYSNPEFDQKLKEANAADSDEERFAKYEEAQEILFEDMPGVPLWQTDVTGAAAKGVENLEYSWKGVPEFQNITKE
jgi:oligopeptide transport system substrate-binding protein